MKPWLLLALAGAVTLSGARADAPAPAADKFDLCRALNNRIIGPRSGDRPLPLLAGDPSHGLHPACTVHWSALSPANKPLDVRDCYKGSLLQIENDAACGHDTGFLWVSSRWVWTSAEQQQQQQGPHKSVAMCQELETKAVAATRDVPLECEPRTKMRSVDAEPAPTPASQPAAADKAPDAAPPK